MRTRERLLNSPLPAPEVDTPSLLVVRHGQDDESHIDGLFDNGLISDKADEVEQLADEVADFFYNSGGQYSDVRLLHSSKLRTSQTSRIIEQRLSDIGISASPRRVDDLRELYQGEMVLSDDQTLEERVKILESAWSTYGQAVESCDLSYRFGDPLKQADGTVTHEELEGGFAQYGENQYEFTTRAYAFVRDMMQYDFGSALLVVVAHRATVTKIQRIMGACSIQAGYVDTMKPGDLRFVERKMERTKVEHAQGVILPIRQRRFARDIIERELVHLRNQQQESV